MNKRLRKELDRLMRKNEDRCSICKRHYAKEDVVFTCAGYDKRRKLQTTSHCCHDKLVKLVVIGLCGPIHPADIDEALKEHPLYSEFHNEQLRFAREEISFETFSPEG